MNIVLKLQITSYNKLNDYQIFQFRFEGVGHGSLNNSLGSDPSW